ncbi:MAG: ketopantoate reductase family protein [Thermodesulfobacteriota bacterium]
MRIIAMGAGPIGGIIGGRLAHAGNPVTLVDVNPEHVRAIREHGLEVNVPDGPFKVSVPTLFPDEVTGKFDLALIAVRSYDTPRVLSSLKSHLNQRAILVSLQNGINPPLLEELVGPDHAIGTVIRMRSRLLGPGRLETQARGHLYVGHLHGRTTPQLTAVHGLFNSVIPTEITSNIFGFLWSKLTFTSLGLFEALSGVPLKEIWQSQPNRRLSMAFMAELTAVGAAAGVRFEPLEEYDPSDFLPGRPYEDRQSAFAEMALNWKSDKPGNIARALKSGLRTEVDFTVGHAVREGERVGIRTPICQAVVELIHEIEQGKRPPQLENYEGIAAAALRSPPPVD